MMISWIGAERTWITSVICSTVPFDIYIRYNPDSDKIRFNGDCKKDFIHYVNQTSNGFYPNNI